ncbi:yteA family sporulation protein [Bacillus sp. FJAT-42376]|uniref:yteA family sporulation protein n=1 Tax=Bacillus sp. FJAT-42376 TaxID=2014076 RepID=UPI000F4E6D7C|nr:yteA family sporulation protein [Bacillus sp. FJAT-42376]AZB44107.1 yteA family sporulation protein [Bacillus sp. FJAT-42376]
MLTDQQLNVFRKQLQTKKEELEKRFAENGHFGLESGHPHDSAGELSSYDNHPGDEATELFEREKDIALNEHAEEELRDIKRALMAIENKTYGKCEVCGEDIPSERLEAIPSATTCKAHSPNQSVSSDRPIEEQVLAPPFGRFTFDNRDVEAFDAEDTYQETARYGSSESPSDFEYPMEDYNDAYTESDDRIGYVEDFENFAGTDMEGKNVTIFPNKQHEKYEDELDAEGIMTSFGDLPSSEKEPYTDH